MAPGRLFFGIDTWLAYARTTKCIPGSIPYVPQNTDIERLLDNEELGIWGGRNKTLRLWQGSIALRFFDNPVLILSTIQVMNFTQVFNALISRNWPPLFG